MYRDGTIRKYLDDAAAGIPAPGGGSVSALAGALATTMGSMAANFTVGKKKFLDVEPRVREILTKLDGLRERLLELVDEDVKAYGVVSAAYGMPKETSEEKTARSAKIQEALVGPSPDELELAKKLIITSETLDDQTNAAQASSAAMNELYGLGYDFDEKFRERVKKVTIEDTKAAARKYFRHFVLTVTAPDEKIAAGVTPKPLIVK